MREIAFTYDANGNVTSVTPPTRPAHGFDYTPIDQLEVYTPPDLGFSPRTTLYAYNPDGQVTSVTRPDSQQILVAYEPNGRTDFVTLPTGVVDVGYDGSGRVGSVSAPGGVGATFTYDGPLVTSIATTGPVAGSVGFAYDDDFELTSRSIAGGGSVGFDYDDDGLLVQAGALTLSRNPASGFLEATTLATVTDSRTRTAFGELDVYEARVSGSPVFAYDLDRDPAGRITRKTETVEGTTSVWEYAYHPDRGWLVEVKRDGVVVETYVYDPNGNRTIWTDFWGSGSATYDDQDRQLTAGAAVFTYTANGERLTKTQGPDVTTYEYDVRGALLGVDLPSGLQVDYLVDAGGRRIGKKIGGTLVQGWLYAGGISPVAELDAAGTITTTFVYATKGNVPDYLVKNGTTYRLLTDHLGSVRLVLDATTGTVAQRLDYDAHGRITFDSNPGFQPFGYAGGLYDPQSGLVRFGARDYDPETGRWTTKDPIGFAGGSAGLYAYVGNDPINFSDPSGLAGSRRESLESCREIVEDTYLGVLEGTLDLSINENLAGPLGGVVVYFATKVVGGIACEAAHWDVLTIPETVNLGFAVGLAGRSPTAAARSNPSTALIPRTFERLAPNGGFLGGYRQRITLEAGTIVDRFGYRGGRYTSPAGTPFSARGLPPEHAQLPFERYEVLKPLPADAGIAGYAFGGGGGVQYEFLGSIQSLIDAGFLGVAP